LIVCDEAHRTAGAADNNRDVSSFVKVHDSHLVKAVKRLYMTATPRVYTENAKTQVSREDFTAYSMDDDAIFGPEFHRLRFGQAVAADILTDYKVLVLGVPQSQADEFLSDFTRTAPLSQELAKVEATRLKSRSPNRDQVAASAALKLKGKHNRLPAK
jgi:predicted helicase